MKELQDFQQEVKSKVADLAGQAHLHILEQAQEKLHARRQMYVDALSSVQEVSPGVHVIVLDRKAVWIEEGMEPHSMVDDLLRNNAKTAKDGSKYRAIPFDMGKGRASQTAGQNELNMGLRQELKKRNIAYKSVERHPDGSPKTGTLHSFSVGDAPLRPSGTEGKHGFGKGPVGAVMQGPAASGGTPLLAGVRITQTALFKNDAQGNRVPDLNKKGQQKAVRGIMTFRVVSSKHKGTLWEHPGIESVRFFDETEKWAEAQWSNRILPEILARFK